MTDEEYHQNMQRFRRRHWLHFGVQGGLLGGAALAGHHQPVALAAIDSRLATWPVLLALLVAVPLVSIVLYAVCQSIKPNLRRPYAENMRIYQSRLVVRNSLLGLLGLPLLAVYILTHHAGALVAYGALLLLLSRQTVPSAKTYQRWLLS
ncbi:hypothetical protein GO988_12445 [Hymenobacter sp. HMF4947]|uniref:Uncharacterized protein n=1 Tax=Hymenobacter ginkgonis TaxID=2682976 RepID=A0A7K1TFF9_9BACT|nr:hypothetical protein [Hymenobacter ginkgonis]MVN77137.1 hypothetical protein [Hymenobacter ginkgonis]